MARKADLDELAPSLPQTTKELSEDGRPEYRVHGKLCFCQRGRRKDAVDPETGERLDDVLMSQFDGYPAVLLRIPSLAQLDLDELGDLVAEAWLTRAQKRVAKPWLAAQA